MMIFFTLRYLELTVYNDNTKQEICISNKQLIQTKKK